MKVRVLNLCQSPWEIQPNVVIGRAVQIGGELVTLIEEKDGAERDNFSTVPHIGVTEEAVTEPVI